MAAEPQPLISQDESILVRRATPADAERCGRICFDAFVTLANKHNFPPDFPSAEMATQVLAAMFANPAFFCVVAEQDGRIVGSNCLDERGVIAGVGPITIDPVTQNKSVGRQLMQAAMTRAAEKKFAGVRLVQAAYHTRSLSLYAKLGFVVREPLACMQGALQERSSQKNLPGYHVRPAQASDLRACNDICARLHGHDREGELKDAIDRGTAVVAEAEGTVRAYATAAAFFGHAVAVSNRDLQALISAAAEFQGPGILVPARNAELFRWCLERGLQVVQTMNLMTTGLYNEPTGAYLPSVLY
jgi:GNAT superfamily N-acetyltransferase